MICGVEDHLEAEASINRWPDPAVKWHIVNPGAFGGLAADQVLAAIRWAWAQWAAVCGIKPEQAASAAEAHVVIECRTIDRAGGTLAWSELADGTERQKGQRYDASEAWVSQLGASVPSTRIDLGRVACHEIGHVLGIPHLGNGNLMQPLYDIRIWTPQAGDIAEAVARYGPSLPSTPPAPPPPAAGEWSLTAGGITIRGTGQVTAAALPGFRVTPLAGAGS